jgi:hypothetical protein
VTPITESCLFEPGVADFCPGWFMQRHEVSIHLLMSLIYIQFSLQRMEDALYISQELRKPEGAKFIKAIHDAEFVLNCVAMLICPELHSISVNAIQKLKAGEELFNWDDVITQWPSIFSGIEVISNRITPPHRDPKAAPTMYDILVSAGTHTESWLDLQDVNARLVYNPGTVVALCGRVLRHGVQEWVGGERICIAHFIRDAVHERLNLPSPDWVKSSRYVAMMNESFVNRQNW